MAPLVRRGWAPAGQTPILLQSMRSHRKVSAIAALVWDTGSDKASLYFRLHPDTNITRREVLAFSRALFGHLKGPVLWIWDRLGAHKAREVVKFITTQRQTTLLPLPPYAPELNPIEYVWCYLKYDPLANLAPESLEELVTVSRFYSRQVQRNGELLKNLLLHSPLFSSE